jgi:hypothetical protein
MIYELWNCAPLGKPSGAVALAVEGEGILDDRDVARLDGAVIGRFAVGVVLLTELGRHDETEGLDELLSIACPRPRTAEESDEGVTDLGSFEQTIHEPLVARKGQALSRTNLVAEEEDRGRIGNCGHFARAHPFRVVRHDLVMDFRGRNDR